MVEVLKYVRPRRIMAEAVTLVAAGVVEVADMVGKRELDFELSFIIILYYGFGRSDQMPKRQTFSYPDQNQLKSLSGTVLKKKKIILG